MSKTTIRTEQYHSKTRGTFEIKVAHDGSSFIVTAEKGGKSLAPIYKVDYLTEISIQEEKGDSGIRMLLNAIKSDIDNGWVK